MYQNLIILKSQEFWFLCYLMQYVNYRPQIAYVSSNQDLKLSLISKALSAIKVPQSIQLHSVLRS